MTNAIVPTTAGVPRTRRPWVEIAHSLLLLLLPVRFRTPPEPDWFQKRVFWTRLQRAATVATMHSGPTGLPAVVVVGAGAAGIGAGLALARSGVPYIILEASSRVGGRAFTDCDSLGSLFDHGCHWFHSADRNPLRVLADRLGHAYARANAGCIHLCRRAIGSTSPNANTSTR